MTDATAPRTADANGSLWGARARDWAEVQEGQFAAGYDDVLARAGVGPGTRLLDAGCGAGMAAMRAAALGAKVSGIDAAPFFWTSPVNACRGEISARANLRICRSPTTPSTS